MYCDLCSLGVEVGFAVVFECLCFGLTLRCCGLCSLFRVLVIVVLCVCGLRVVFAVIGLGFD